MLGNVQSLRPRGPGRCPLFHGTDKVLLEAIPVREWLFGLWLCIYRSSGAVLGNIDG